MPQPIINNACMDLMHKEAIGEELGVSLATVNNWIKTAVIPSPDIQNYYSEKSYKHILNKLKRENKRLNSRANRSMQRKKEICYLGITDKERKYLLERLVDDFEKSNLSVDDGVFALSFALLCSNHLINPRRKNNNRSRIDTMLSSWTAESGGCESVMRLYAQYRIPNLDDDILGAFYQSIQSVAWKSSRGSYYTPAELLKDITIAPDKTVLDPCCGSGGLLLNVLTKSHDHSKIFARDVDATALKICFVNLALFFNDPDIAVNISKQDITLNSSDDLFSQADSGHFDYVITNPPWGGKIPKKEKENLLRSYPELATPEIFSVSLYNSLKMLKKDGELFFFLPHAFLNVAAHRNIRKHIFNKTNKISIKLLGNAFKGVMSENILLHIKKSLNESKITIQGKTGSAYKLPVKNIVPPDYIVSAASNRRDASILEKIYGAKHITLQNDAVFALGIVTGNNEKHLLNKASEKAEPVFRGRDIEKYKFLDPEYFIKFQPEMYQQTAPVEYYRQKKIVYRFICDKIVCVLDNNNRLLLNSANLFVPRNYPMESVVSFFNSDIYTFIFRKKFYSKKVLKSHLQNLPLPVLTYAAHQYIYDLYNKTFMPTGANIDDFQKEMDEIICASFFIDKSQYHYMAEGRRIRQALMEQYES
jgi:type I restriction-modification system DNA methylase subunit